MREGERMGGREGQRREERREGGKEERERDELCMLVHTCKLGNLIQESEISLDYQVSVRHKTRSYGDVEL